MFSRALSVALFLAAASSGCRPEYPPADGPGADPAAMAHPTGPSVRAEDRPKLADTADEEEVVRRAVSNRGPATASRDILTRPYPRVLVVPMGLEAVYKAKPQATVRLLLKVLEEGRAWDSIHAACCIEALVESPEFAAITAGANPKTWDNVIGQANPHTHREHNRRVCIKLITEKEAGTVAGEKK